MGNKSKSDVGIWFYVLSLGTLVTIAFWAGLHFAVALHIVAPLGLWGL